MSWIKIFKIFMSRWKNSKIFENFEFFVFWAKIANSAKNGEIGFRGPKFRFFGRFRGSKNGRFGAFRASLRASYFELKLREHFWVLREGARSLTGYAGTPQRGKQMTKNRQVSDVDLEGGGGPWGGSKTANSGRFWPILDPPQGGPGIRRFGPLSGRIRQFREKSRKRPKLENFRKFWNFFRRDKNF